MSNQENAHTWTILIADDEEISRNGLRFLITKHFHNIEVLEAANGLECWQILISQPAIALLFVDIHMPGLSGLQICEKIKASSIQVRVVIFSGFRDFEYARQALRYGVTDYLLKPVNPSEILHLLSALQAQDTAATEPELLTDKQDSLIVERLRTWIHGHLHEEITLTDFCEKFHYSVSYLSTLFKKETGKGFLEYLVDCRMQRARHLLLDPSLRITDIARQAGYTNAKAFSITFRKTFGITPTEYREKSGFDS